MRSLCVLLAIVASTTAIPLIDELEKAPAIDFKLIETINQDPNATWISGVNDIFAGLTIQDVRDSYLGWLGPEGEDPNLPVQRHDDVSLEWLPRNFNSYEEWPNFTHPIRNQGACGSCWAFGATEAFEDRLAIASSGRINKVLSTEELTSCALNHDGCRGGLLSKAWHYIAEEGLVSETCFPYTAGGRKTKTPPCLVANHSCVDGEPFTVYKASRVFGLKSETDIKAEIRKNGPVEAAFSVYSSFLHYKSGVYVRPANDTRRVGGHAIKVVGWGEEPGEHWWSRGTPYWLCANSWGAHWGMEGFFKILRGSDMCGIERYMIAGTPAL